MAHRDKIGHLLPFSKTSVSFDRDYRSLPFVNQRQASPLIRKDCNGHLLSVFRDYQSPLYHPETSESDDIWDDNGHPFLIVLEIFAASFFIQRQSSPMSCKDSLLSSRDDQVLGRAKTLFCYLEMIKSDSIRRLSRLSIFIAFKAPRLLLLHLMSFMLFLLTGFVDWSIGRSGGNSARTKLVSYLYFPFISNKR